MESDGTHECAEVDKQAVCVCVCVYVRVHVCAAKTQCIIDSVANKNCWKAMMKRMPMFVNNISTIAMAMRKSLACL